jgi:hypothetical protein
MPLSRVLREAAQQREDDAAAQEFVELLLQVLSVPEVAEAVAAAIVTHLRTPARTATIPATDRPLPKPPPFVSGRGHRPKPR